MFKCEAVRKRSMRALSRRFFMRSTVEVARSLIGKYLVYDSPQGRIAGKIVETEAYLEDDPAAHSFRGQTRRNAPMFGLPGTAYVYFTYGMYHCFNVVTRKEGVGEAVLIRAVEPVDGVDVMRRNRKREKVEKLCSGPAKLVLAFGITPEMNGDDVTQGTLRICSDGRRASVRASQRIGISKGTELPYRFTMAGSEFLSR